MKTNRKWMSRSMQRRIFVALNLPPSGDRLRPSESERGWHPRRLFQERAGTKESHDTPLAQFRRPPDAEYGGLKFRRPAIEKRRRWRRSRWARSRRKRRWQKPTLKPAQQMNPKRMLRTKPPKTTAPATARPKTRGKKRSRRIPGPPILMPPSREQQKVSTACLPNNVSRDLRSLERRAEYEPPLRSKIDRRRHPR
jgi:hypothetical protein